MGEYPRRRFFPDFTVKSPSVKSQRLKSDFKFPKCTFVGKHRQGLFERQAGVAPDVELNRCNVVAVFEALLHDELRRSHRFPWARNREARQWPGFRTPVPSYFESRKRFQLSC